MGSRNLARRFGYERGERCAPGARRAPLGDQRGLTLTEIAVVLAILAFLVAQGVPALQRWKERMDLRVAAAKLSEVMLQARTRAVVERRDYTVTVDYASDTFAASPLLDTTRQSGTVDIYADTSDPDCPPLSSGDVVFRPNSSADAAGFEAVYLKGKSAYVLSRYRVKVLGATGKVSVEKLVGGAWTVAY